MLDMLEGVDNLCCHGHERDEAGYVIAGTQKGPPQYERAFFGLEKGIGEIEKKPDNPEAQHNHHH